MLHASVYQYVYLYHFMGLFVYCVWLSISVSISLFVCVSWCMYVRRWWYFCLAVRRLLHRVTRDHRVRSLQSQLTTSSCLELKTFLLILRKRKYPLLSRLSEPPYYWKHHSSSFVLLRFVIWNFPCLSWSPFGEEVFATIWNTKETSSNKKNELERPLAKMMSYWVLLLLLLHSINWLKKITDVLIMGTTNL